MLQSPTPQPGIHIYVSIYIVKYKESIKQNQEFKYLSHSVSGTKRDSHRLKTHNNEHVDLAWNFIKRKKTFFHPNSYFWGVRLIFFHGIYFPNIGHVTMFSENVFFIGSRFLFSNQFTIPKNLNFWKSTTFSKLNFGWKNTYFRWKIKPIKQTLKASPNMIIYPKK